MLTGLLVGEAKYGTVRSSVFAPADYQPARISDFFTTHRVSPQKLMAKLTELVLRLRHSGESPERMFWIADSAHTEKPYAEKIASLGLFHRTKRVVGRAKHLKGRCYVCAAHLYQHFEARGQMRSRKRALRRAALGQRPEHSGAGRTTRGATPASVFNATFPKRGFIGLSYRVATIHPGNSSMA